MALPALTVLVCALSVPTQALTTYDDRMSADFGFTGLREETNTAGDPEPIYGDPILSGDSLVFAPTDFTSSASGGVSDQTAATFQGMITSLDPFSTRIDQLVLQEQGDFDLTGSGGVATSASVLAGLAIVVLEVNDGGVITPTSIDNMENFFLNFDTPTQGGDWTGTAIIDVAHLVKKGFGIDAFATKVLFTFDNVLSTTSESGSTAFMQNKTDVLSLIVIPEPATGLLLGAGLVLLGVRRRH